MSYDLMVFDPKAPPPDRAGFMAWYREQTQWRERHSYNDPEVSTPELRRWFLDMITNYPVMNGPHASADPNNPKITDYSVGKSVIYAAFAWSAAEAAFQTMFSLSRKHRVGFFDVSGTNGGVWVPGLSGAFSCIHGQEANSGNVAILQKEMKPDPAHGPDAAMSFDQLQKLTDVSDWKFFLQEGSIIGRRGLSDRDIKVDLSGLGRLRRSPKVTTQVPAYASFARLRPIHARIDEALEKPRGVCEAFHVHERQTFSVSFTSNWRSELRQLLSQVEGWGAALDLEVSVSNFVASRPDGPSVPQINHLVGLAFLGDFTTLEDYARIFAKGLRLNFGPVITPEAIEAALAASYDYFVERKTQVAPGASPNGGAATPPGSSGTLEAPPSVS
jgi:hypothetical protein